MTSSARPWQVQYDDAMRAAVGQESTMPALLAAAVATGGERTALAYRNERVTYHELDEVSDGLATDLTASGFAPGARAAVLLQSVPEFVIAAFSVWKAGGVVVPINPMYRERELADLLTDSAADVLVCEREHWREFSEHLIGRTPVRTVRLAEELRDIARRRAGDSLPRPATTPSDIALLSYTSGTSGRPKAARNTHANLTWNAGRLTVSMNVPRHGVVFALAPLFHITGMVSELAATIHVGGTLVLTRRFDAGIALAALRRHRPHYMVGPPTAYLALLDHPDATADHFRSFRALVSGGAPLSTALIGRLRAKCGHYLLSGYGLTETTAGCVAIPLTREAPIDPASGVRAVGVPVPGADVRIVDDAGADMPVGERGEIVIRGPMIVPGYWNRPEEDAAAFRDGWFHSGDVGFMDADGWVYVVDRIKDVIIASGFKVMPTEVEEVLYRHEAVREAAVVGGADPYRGETVVAYVSLRDGHTVTGDELMEHCRRQLAAYKYPRRVEILAELPKNATGKILRRLLREPSATAQ